MVSMPLGRHLLSREALVGSLAFLQSATRSRLNRWLKGRHEYRKLQACDYVIVSFPKSGRTWLRIMLSRYYQVSHGVTRTDMLGSANYHKQNSKIPTIMFTHDNYLGDYTKDRDSKAAYYGKKVVLLVRDPRDVAVSWYHARRFRPNPSKRHVGVHEVGENVPDMFAFVFDSLERIIGYMNLWAREQGRMRAFMMVRYEDLKADPAGVLDRVARFLGTPGSDEAIAEAVGYASFKNMRKLEQSQAFGADDRKMAPGDRSDVRSYKVRRAKIGGYRDYFTPAQVAEIDALVAERLSPGLGYGAAPPTTDPGPKASDGSN
jgi:hypothetical protein